MTESISNVPRPSLRLANNEPFNLDTFAQNHVEKQTIVPLASGEQAVVTVYQGFINIDLPNNSAIYFHATLMPNPSGILALSIITKNPDAKTHSDFYAGRLADEAIAFFDRRFPPNGISAIDVAWDETIKELGKSSNNYLTYVRIKPTYERNYLSQGKTKQEANLLAQKDAAFATWTGGRIAKRHGFTQFKIIDENIGKDGSIIGRFSRP